MKKIKTRKALKKLVKKARRSSALKKWGTGAALGAVVVGAATAGGLALKRARAKAKKAAAKKRRPAARKRKAAT